MVPVKHYTVDFNLQEADKLLVDIRSEYVPWSLSQLLLPFL